MPVWDKIAAVRHYLTKVDALFWLDLDVFIVDPSRRAAELFRRDRSSCTRTGQPEDDAVLAQEPLPCGIIHGASSSWMTCGIGSTHRVGLLSKELCGMYSSMIRTCSQRHVCLQRTRVYESLESPERALQKSGPFAIHATGFKGALAEQKRNAISRAACD
eukprot:CAMPEP_0195042708 /NCGR_PEP_ID=MMETSP0347-20130606/3047_1 /TAXON_ID=2932 /ORGANISM="Alexandrium fundyense, Strain CCMP1719" /LENGTH=159 /DNA_ID=CAMNT_0040069979 /DNA_START=100 /DNA_END=576 /DNA_ORIENTATION=-